MRTIAVLCAALSIVSLSAFADETNTDKSQYTLLHPTPDNLLRPMDSSSMEKIYSPFTVDAGHVEIDADLVSYYNASRQGTAFPGFTYDRSDNLFLWAPLIKVGVLNNVDFEVQPSYQYAYSSQSGNVGVLPYSVNHSKGEFGDVFVAAAVNLWGNDGGTTALAVRPYLDIPTQGGRTVVGGVDVPFAWHLPWHLTLKYSFGIGAVENPNATVYVGFENLLALERQFGDKLTVFCNLATSVTTDTSADWVGYAGFGAGYNITPNFEVYAAMRFGFESGYDYNPYAGISFRF